MLNLFYIIFVEDANFDIPVSLKLASKASIPKIL